MSDQLSPCPFCGSVNVALGSEQAGHGDYTSHIKCQECFAKGPASYGPPSPQDRWNERTGGKPQPPNPFTGPEWSQWSVSTLGFGTAAPCWLASHIFTDEQDDEFTISITSDRYLEVTKLGEDSFPFQCVSLDRARRIAETIIGEEG